MNLVIKSAVAVALLSAASMASFGATITETLPTSGTPIADPAIGNGGLVAEVLDVNTNTYDTINLGGDISTFKVLATATGTTYDYGTISNFSSLFSSADVSGGNVQFLVAAANGATAGHAEGIVTLSSTPTQISNNNASQIAVNLSTAFGNFNGAAGCAAVNPCSANSTVSPGYNGTISPLLVGTLSTTGTVGGAGVEMYDVTQQKTGLGNATIVALSGGNGLWAVSSTGDITYTIAGGSSTVPLPAAIWLLGSGLLGLAGVGRRKKIAQVTA